MSIAARKQLLEDIVGLAKRAGDIAMRYYRTDDLEVESKGDGSPVTVADKAIERFLREELEGRFPDDAILGEEEGPKAGTSGRKWIIDPIDGTKSFTHGVPFFSNLIAMHDEEGAALGIINLPALGETIYAARGVGCYENGTRIHVNNRTEVRDSYLMTSWLEHWTEQAWAPIREAGVIVRTWGDAYGYALCATGRCEAVVDVGIAHYDVAAMPVIMREAGGEFTDLAGADSIESGNGLASNGALHQPMLDALRGLRKAVGA